jgi:hypothetical protein
MIRLYFNKRGGEPWSIDCGPGTPESTHGRVLIETDGRAVYDPKAGDNQNTPTAWIEFPRGTLIERNGTALILKEECVRNRLMYDPAD